MTNEEARQILLENFIVPQISDNTEEASIYNEKMQKAFNIALYALEYMSKICSTCRYNDGEHNPFDTCNHCLYGSEYEKAAKC